MTKKQDKQEADWWLDRFIWKLVAPILWLIPKGKTSTSARSPRTTKVLYGSSEPCYCGSEKKYKHCCKKVNKRSGKVALKVIRRTKRGTRERIKLINQTRAPQRLFTNPVDSGIDPIHFDG